MRRTLWLIAAVAGMLLTVLVVARCNRPRVATLAALTGVQNMDLDMARVQADVTALTRAPSRLTGSPGERAARTHIVRSLRAIGARSITLQKFRVPVPVTRMAALEVRRPGAPPVSVPVHPLWPNLARTCQTPPAGLTGMLVYAGAGSEEELRRKPIRDAIVVLDWDADLTWLSVPEFGGRAVVFRGVRPASRTLAQRKYLTVPADIPRYYVAAADVAALDALMVPGATARVRCDVAWEQAATANVLAKLCDGATNAAATDADQAPLVLHAYYDSISVVPDRAPGAEQACGAALLLELARQLVAQPSPRPVYVLFTSGHGQALAGITHFVQGVRGGATIRPGLMIGLDISSCASTFGVFTLGQFRPQNEAFVTHKYSTLGRELFSMAQRCGQPADTNALLLPSFVDGINSSSGRGWWTYFPYMNPMEGEVANLAGLPSITFATVNDNRSFIDTPDDTPANLRPDLLARQLTTAGGTQAGLVRLVAALTRWQGPFLSSPVDDNWCSVSGRAVWLDQQRDYAPNQPLAQAMVFLKQGDGAKYFCGTRGMVSVMTDARGRFVIPGLRKLNFLDLNPTAATPPQGVLEAYAAAAPAFLAANPEAGARYQAMAGGATNALVADGAVLFALDMARPDDYPWAFRALGAEEHINLVLFPCGTVTLSGLTDPRSYVPLSDLRVMEAATKSPPFQFGASMSDLAGRDPSENIATVWTQPTLRILLTGGVGFQGRRLMLINNTPAAPEGKGFVLAELKTLPSMVLQCARDMWNIDASRMQKLTRNGVNNPRVSAHHAEAAALLRDAAAALARLDYAGYRIAAERGWAIEGQAYTETIGMVNNMIHGVLFYLALLLPLSYCVERLLIASETIMRRINWIGAIFATSFGILALVHPAFRFTLTPLLVLLAFVICAMVITVGVLIVGRVDALLQARKQAAGGRHDDQYRRAGVAVRALDLGMSNIRRRPQRGLLTGLTVVVVTFILLSFTSLVPVVSISRLAHPRGVPAYVGLLSRDRAWNALPEPLCDSLRRTYAGVTGAVVAARAWFYSDAVGQFSVIDLGAVATERRTTISALACMEPGDARITSVTNTLVAGRWFTSPDEAAIILSRHTAAQLGYSTYDIGRVVRVFSKELPLIGIVDGPAFDRVRDLDGEPLTPVNMVMQQASRAQRAQAGQGGQRADTLDDYVHYAMDQIAIVPFWYGAELRATVRSIAIRLPAGADVDGEAAGYARRANLTILGADGAAVTLYAALNTSQLSAAWQIVVPILLATVMILGTMMGSVYERRGEIAVYNSVGLSPTNVAALFVAEAAVYAVVGAGVGYLLGQSVAKLLHLTGWLPGLTLNYTAGSAILVTMLTMLIVLASALYPARQAFMAAMPDVEKEVDAQAVQQGDAQDALCIWLPFVATPGHILAMQAYLAEFLDSVQGVTIGQLAVDNLAASVPAFGGKSAPTLAFRAWLSPFDLGVSHDAELAILWRAEHGVYQYHLSATRYSGDRQNWRRLTPRFVQLIRKQLLMWRILGPDEQRAYEDAGSHMFNPEHASA